SNGFAVFRVEAIFAMFKKLAIDISPVGRKSEVHFLFFGRRGRGREQGYSGYEAFALIGSNSSCGSSLEYYLDATL
nr:hypothetical protein [Tanacetum cinerariifolium]